VKVCFSLKQKTVKRRGYSGEWIASQGGSTRQNKSEIRISKSETNPNEQIANSGPAGFGYLLSWARTSSVL
jgi:hypothetical protein